MSCLHGKLKVAILALTQTCTSESCFHYRFEHTFHLYFFNQYLYTNPLGRIELFVINKCLFILRFRLNLKALFLFFVVIVNVCRFFTSVIVFAPTTSIFTLFRFLLLT